MKLSQNETALLILTVICAPKESARAQLFQKLKARGISEAEFCKCVRALGEGMMFNAEEWADFLEKVPNRLFWAEPWLVDKLTPNQRRKLNLSDE